MAKTQDLKDFFEQSRNGANSFYRHPLARRLVYSDGVNDMAELAGAYWLLDIIGTEMVDPYLKDWNNGIAGMGIIKLSVHDSKMVITLEVDDDTPPTYRRVIDYTDFPEGEWQLWMNPDGEGSAVLILASEY